jgi:hypothetical protein
LRKVTIRFVMYGRSFPRPRGTARLSLDGLSWNLISEYVSKYVEEIDVLLKYDKNNGYLTWRPFYIYYHTHAVLQRMRNLQTDFVEKITTYILCLITFIIHCALYEITWKDIVEPDRPQVTILRVRITRWIPTATHTHTHWICNIYRKQKTYKNLPSNTRLVLSHMLRVSVRTSHHQAFLISFFTTVKKQLQLTME